MPLRATKEVIGGHDVTRYNGNNPQGSGPRGGPKDRKKDTWKRSAWAGYKKAREAQTKEGARQGRLEEYAEAFLLG